MEINLNWPEGLPPEMFRVIKQHAEASARNKAEAIVGLQDMRELTITVIGSGPGDMKLAFQGPSWLLARIERGFSS